ncbi:polysaccharide pyruvyl transferase family protein [Chryseobacterium lathyri]|uniref:Polysaccharide pyruvyl transferase WcaK-like protein n=1 Tax=Chryseobacterium lathyri TaxID=395933 RepID=A0ABT9SKT8_9FLAO|nr:polysaccharide pyruvyl transferase family protein [Chryseobacterium lathyri]MDP9960032.1 polysaccharide pyruvyl transferase WcaK-like protein [Chryseobacterium lathyri]MDQ0064412.1 polysaccharide pyruvyl transferase WcaK-like protein [Chryseobacterium lathyri]
MNISIKGAYGDSNFGDDLLMIVFEDFIKANFKNKSLNFIGAENNYVSKFLSDSSYNNNQEDNLLVYGGGTQFFSFIEKSTFRTKLKNNISNNPVKILKKVLQKISPGNDTVTSCEKAFLGFGLGPFNNNVQAIEFAKNQLKDSLFTGVRDQISFNYCNDWNIKSFLGADVVFSSYFNRHIQNVSKTEDTNKIGIIVRDWDWKNSSVDYQDQLISFVNSNPHLDVTFIVFAKDKDPKWLKRIQDYKSIVWHPETMEISDFIETLNSFSTFITARYHGAIIAGLLGKKVICVEIEPKLRILTEQIPSFALWDNHFEIGKLEDLLKSDLEDDHQKYISALRSKADDMLNQFVKKYNSKFNGE